MIYFAYNEQGSTLSLNEDGFLRVVERCRGYELSKWLSATGWVQSDYLVDDNGVHIPIFLLKGEL